MPRYAPNKMPAEVKRRYFELIRKGWKGAAAARAVGVSMSCGSVWFIDAGGVSYVETPISSRYLSQDDRLENTNGLLRQYFPKGTDLSVWTSEQLDQVAAELNDRPRECLNDRSPSELMRRWQRQQAPA